MINIQEYIENKVRNTISDWCEDGIYVISFFIYPNDSYEYEGITNIPSFCISYNTEVDCNGADALSEERWNYAFWRQDEVPIIDAYSENEGIKLLFDWYKEQGIDNIGYEDDDCYDDKMRYIGKGPVGYYELLLEITAVAKKLQESGFIQNKFGKTIPIIIHDLEYPWYIIEASRTANPHGEADTFLLAMKQLGFTD